MKSLMNVLTDYRNRPVTINVYDRDEFELLQMAEEVCDHVLHHIDESIDFTLSLLEWNND